MSEKFEVKLKGRIGHEDHDLKEMRVLNRIIRVVPEGLTYEADPRHVELLVRSLNLEDCKKVGTPGVKLTADEVFDEPDTTPEDVVASIQFQTSRARKVHFGDTDVVEIPAYSHVYGHHPRKFVIWADCNGRTHFYRLGPQHDAYTGINMSRLQRRREILLKGPNGTRRRALHNVLVNGAAWEDSVENMVAAVSKKKKYEVKRLGTKAVKAAERLSDTSGNLNSEGATTYRALAARINYLAIDRPDLAFTAKELCRDFACPTGRSVERLKRAVRYLRHRPRLVYKYSFQDCDDKLKVFVDTDFAGDLETRRSTSGGTIFRGNHLLYHWSQTQTTVALSSAEAELSGICKGASKAIGMRSTLHELGLDFQLEVCSDASAAIGICKRRGLGKIRHLAVADLWIQDHLRNNDFVLNKVKGPDNPADVLTKFVDKVTLEKHIDNMSLASLEGRAESAPMISGQ